MLSDLGYSQPDFIFSVAEMSNDHDTSTRLSLRHDRENDTTMNMVPRRQPCTMLQFLVHTHLSLPLSPSLSLSLPLSLSLSPPLSPSLALSPPLSRSLSYPFQDVAARMSSISYINRYSAVPPTRQTLVPIHSSAAFSQYLFGPPLFLWPFTFPSSINFSSLWWLFTRPK